MTSSLFQCLEATEIICMRKITVTLTMQNASIARSLLFSLIAVFAPALRADFHVVATAAGHGAENDVPVRAVLVNGTAAEITDIQLVVGGTGFTIADPSPWSCADQGTFTRCFLNQPLDAGATSPPFDAVVHFDRPSRRGVGFSAYGTSGGHFVAASSSVSPALYKPFPVTSADDSGPGTLRAAIEQIAADPACANTPCGARFDIDAPGVQRITLLSPLPLVRGDDVVIDASTQTELHGDADPNGPEVIIDGGGMFANGIHLAATDRAEVAALGVENFAYDGIHQQLGEASTLTPGLFVSDSLIRHNGRGIGIGPGRLPLAAIRNNVIRDNQRSGIFDESGGALAGSSLVAPMEITGNQLIGNGASGIYFGPVSFGARVEGNVIQHNHDFGIGIGAGAQYVQVRANSIAHNGGAAIDIGLDGPTFSVALPIAFVRSAAIIDSARYDPASNTTAITGRPGVTPIIGDCDLCSTNIVSLYANDAEEHGEYAEAQTYLGDAAPQGAGWTFTFPGDLRGKYISALNNRWTNFMTNYYNTAELSKAVLVR
jgi:Right handed beta helix region